MSQELATVEKGVLEKLVWIDGPGDTQRLGLMVLEVSSNLNESVILFVTSTGQIQWQLKCHLQKMQLFSPHETFHRKMMTSLLFPVFMT